MPCCSVSPHSTDALLSYSYIGSSSVARSTVLPIANSLSVAAGRLVADRNVYWLRMRTKAGEWLGQIRRHATVYRLSGRSNAGAGF